MHSACARADQAISDVRWNGCGSRALLVPILQHGTLYSPRVSHEKGVAQCVS